MAANTLTQSLGLNYLNEQQRFQRTQAPVYNSIEAQPIISDFRVKSPNRPVFAEALAAIPQNAKIVHMMPKSTKEARPLKLDSATLQTEEKKVNHFSNQLQTVATPKTRLQKIQHTLPICIAATALLGGFTVLGLSLHQNHQAAAQVAAITAKVQSSSGSADTPPSEAPVTANAVNTYKVAANLPRTITIKKVNVNARILSLGVLDSGAMATPKNTNDSGWYNGSSKPGENGAMVILGHVSGATTAGVFGSLKRLVNGDVITVERGDGKVFTYKVVKNEQVPADKVDMAALLVPVTVGKPGLNLITCGGTYDPKNETFDQRVVVYTEQV